MIDISKLICFDSPYSMYFNELGKSIKDKLSIDLEYCRVDKNYSMYLPDFCLLNIAWKKPSSSMMPYYLNKVSTIKNLANIPNAEYSDKHIEATAIIYYSLECYLKERTNAIIFLYNDLRIVNSFVGDIARNLGIKTFFFERGVVRPNTTSLDIKGVNANSRFSQLIFDRERNYNCIFKVESIREDKKYIKRQFFLFKLFELKYKLERVIKFTPLSYIDNPTLKKGFFHYLKLSLRQRLIWGKTIELSDFLIENKYIFVALQLSTDTQTLLQSEFSSTQHFIDHITSEFIKSRFVDDHKLVFKIHPMDVESYYFDDSVFVSNAPTEKLLEHCDYCITINSTVGFEAAFIKPVVCFGNSFYTEHGIVCSSSRGSLDDSIDMASKVFSKRLKINYYNFLLSEYQLPGSIFNYNEIDIDTSSNIIIEKLGLELL